MKGPHKLRLGNVTWPFKNAGLDHEVLKVKTSTMNWTEKQAGNRYSAIYMYKMICLSHTGLLHSGPTEALHLISRVTPERASYNSSALSWIQHGSEWPGWLCLAEVMVFKINTPTKMHTWQLPSLVFSNRNPDAKQHFCFLFSLLNRCSDNEKWRQNFLQYLSLTNQHHLFLVWI